MLELEENNKWTLLTMVYIMQALDRNRYREETLTVLEKLIKCDKYRCNFYKDMRKYFFQFIIIIDFLNFTDEIILIPYI